MKPKNKIAHKKYNNKNCKKKKHKKSITEKEQRWR